MTARIGAFQPAADCLTVKQAENNADIKKGPFRGLAVKQRGS